MQGILKIIKDILMIISNNCRRETPNNYEK